MTTLQSTQTINPLIYSDGPLNAEVLIVSDFFSLEEAHKNKVFSNAAGIELQQICYEAGIHYKSAFKTVLFPFLVTDTNLSNLLYPTDKKTKQTYRQLYLTEKAISALHSFTDLIDKLPKLRLIIGCGNWPLWFFTDKTSISTQKGYKFPGGISKWRGSQLFYTTKNQKQIPFLPIIHPSTILKDYTQHYITVHDLKTRAGRFLNHERNWLTPSNIFISKPSYHDILEQITKWLQIVKNNTLHLSVDIETWKRKHISCIGLADNKTSLCIPFFYFSKEGELIDYFNPEEEESIWLDLKILLEHPNVKIIGQNFIYDYQFLYRLYNIKANFAFDTMLAHHLLWPGTPKSLDHLASLYLDHYVYWKDESQDWDGAFGHEELWIYNCKDVRATYDIFLELNTLLTKLNMQDKWAIQVQQWHLAKEMMLRGLAVNQQHLSTIHNELNILASQLEDWLINVMPSDLKFTSAGGPWFSSPKFQMYIFYDVLGLNPVLHKKTKKPTLDITALSSLKEKHQWLSPIFQSLEDLRSIAVFRSHFLDINLSPDKRLRCNFNVGGTETFRWSSSANGFGEGTNFQNIPKGDD